MLHNYYYYFVVYSIMYQFNITGMPISINLKLRYMIVKVTYTYIELSSNNPRFFRLAPLNKFGPIMYIVFFH